MPSSSPTELSSSFSLSDDSLRTTEDVAVLELVRGVRRLTSPLRDRPELDVTSDSGVRRVDATERVVVRVGVVGPE